MKRSIFIPLVSGLWILGSQFSYAILDTNNNGLSDLWEKTYNNNQLFPNTYDLQADPDGDGWTNLQESTAGTDPLEANPPSGYIQIAQVHFPAVYTTGSNGEPEILTPEAYSFTWPTSVGKLYTLTYSTVLTPDTWQALDEPLIGDGNTMGKVVPITQPDGNTPERLFWRVSVENTDSDFDHLSDSEEFLLGSNPNQADSDLDGIADHDEAIIGTNPTIPRISNFKKILNPDGTVTFTWNSVAASGNWFRIEDLQPNGVWKTIYSTTYGSAKLPFLPGTNTYSITLNPDTDFLP